MSDFLSERLPLVTYTNRFSPVAETVTISPQVERLTGYPLAEWLERPGFLESVLHPDDRAHVLEEMRASREEQRAFSRDYRLIGPDGRIIWIHDESVPVADEVGEPELIQGYFVDITERKDLERQLLHAHKLDALGRLAGGIAHDFNNFLMAIGAAVSLALRALPLGAPPRRHLQEALGSVESASRLTRQLVAYSRGQEVAPALIDLAAVVEALRPLLRRVAGDWVRLEFDLAPTPTVHADVGQIEQIVVNLVANARDAHAGAINVRTGAAGGAAVLAVTDDGSGMDEATREHAFEPFFTTKDREQGSGLGLSIVEGIVTRAGGTIELESAPQAGARVEIRLPAIGLG